MWCVGDPSDTYLMKKWTNNGSNMTHVGDYTLQYYMEKHLTA